MYKSIISFFEIGKDKTVNWFIRFQDIFYGFYLVTGGFAMLFMGILVIFTRDVAVGTIMTVVGTVFLAAFAFARKKGMYCHATSYTGAIVNACAIALFLLFGKDNIMYANIISVVFPLSCIRLPLKNAAIFSITTLLFCLISGLIISDTLFLQIAFFIVGFFVLFTICGFSIISSVLVDANDNKISDIQRKNEIQNDFIAKLSYQIRTPLNNIVAIGSILNDTQLTGRQRDLMETILASANNLANVINVFASKIQSAEITTKFNNIPFNLQNLMNSTVQLFVGQSEDYNIALVNFDAPQYFLEGDPVQIKQIFLNLIDTIIKNKKAEKINIFITYRANQGTEQVYDIKFEIKVSDQLDFDFENDWGRTEMISYSIASQLITSMSGNKLTYCYEKNYTVLGFTLSFKKLNEEQFQKDTAEKSAEQVELKEATPSRDALKVDLKEAKVLLVEDNMINQRIVILSIQRLVKSITVANNGQEAVDKFKDSKHDIILMDIQMPVMDGIQATKKIREIELNKRIVPTPIIAITANALAGDREHCLASGMDEYISKPFQVDTLVSKMKNLLAIGSSIR